MEDKRGDEPEAGEEVLDEEDDDDDETAAILATENEASLNGRARLRLFKGLLLPLLRCG